MGRRETVRFRLDGVARASTLLAGLCLIVSLPLGAFAAGQHGQQQQESRPQQQSRPAQQSRSGQGGSRPAAAPPMQRQGQPGSYPGQSHLQYGPPSSQAGPAFRAAGPGQPPIYRGGGNGFGQRGFQPGGAQAGQQARPGHLGSWMEQHQNLDPQSQQRALEREPGFNQLPSEQQARMRARLQQLNQMPAEQRAQVMNRVEGMERLNPEQRQHITNTMGQLRQLPQDQRQAVTRAFGSYRQMPPEQRAAAAQSYQQQMNPQQRAAFNNLVTAEPYLPIQRPPVVRGTAPQ